MVKQPDTTVNRTMNSQPFKQIKIINNHIYPRDQVDDVTLKFLNHMESKIASREPDVGFKQLFIREYQRQFFAGCFLGLGHELCVTSFLFFLLHCAFR